MAALSEIEKLEARYNENPDGRYFAPLADAYRKAGRVDDAITLVTRGLEKHPDYLSAHIVLARCHLDRKDDAAAHASFEKVLSLDPENIIALKALADICERGGRTDEARRWLMKLLAVDSMNSEAEEQLARLGGPLVEAEASSVEAVVQEQPAEESLADIAAVEAPPVEFVSPDAPTAPIPAIELESPAPASLEEVAAAPTLETPALELESPPTGADLEPAAAPPGLSVFDDSLGWGGAGERQSGFVHAEDIAEAEAHHEATAPAIEFLSVEPPRVEQHTEPVAAAAADLPLIMPEDVTPPEELARPTVRQVEAVSPPPVTAPAAGAPMVTETMGDLYLQQGLHAQAAQVYRQLLAQRPDDAGLRAKLAQLEAPRQAYSAEGTGAESAGSWLRRLARSSISAGVPAPVTAASLAPQEPTPMEQAFSAEPESAGEALPVAIPGQPAHPASDAFSLDQVFGSPPGAASASPPAESAAAAASFDEFFGAAPAKPTLRPQESGGNEPPPQDDLSAFNAWLHGLKK